MLNLREILERVDLYQYKTKRGFYNIDSKSTKLPQIRKKDEASYMDIKHDQRYMSLSPQISAQEKQRKLYSQSKAVKKLNLILKTNSRQQNQNKLESRFYTNRGRYQTMGEIAGGARQSEGERKSKSLQQSSSRRKKNRAEKGIKQISQYFKAIIYANRIQQDLSKLNSVGIKYKIIHKHLQEQTKIREHIVEQKQQKQKIVNLGRISKKGNKTKYKEEELDSLAKTRAAVINCKRQKRKDKLQSQYGPWRNEQNYTEINMG